MLHIVPLEYSHLDSARRIATECYDEQCVLLPLLPKKAVVPDLGYFAANGWSWAAFEENELVGYLGLVEPFEGFFGPVMGSFSPLHANAVVPLNRSRIYSRLYQAAAEKLVANQVISHAVVIYAQDRIAKESLFQNGFGLRTIDAIRLVEPLDGAPRVSLSGLTLEELDKQEFAAILPLHHGLTKHIHRSPFFMPVRLFSPEELAEAFLKRKSRIFVIRDKRTLVGYMELSDEGENFVTMVPEMPNICGAYLMPEYRGRGLYAALLDFLLARLAEEGHTHLGVDFEGFNPTALGFWSKYFTAYTHGLTRRIDERILSV